MPFDHIVATQMQGLVFGLLSLPICLWVIATDVREMKIKNNAVLALLAVFVVAGPFLMPLDEYAWRYAHFGVVLVIGFFLSMLGMGAGDAKFAAAMAPFIVLDDFGVIALLYTFWSLALVTGMAIARRSTALKAAHPGWVWLGEDRRRHVPFGVGLAPTLICYLALAAFTPDAPSAVEALSDGGSLLPTLGN